MWRITLASAPHDPQDLTVRYDGSLMADAIANPPNLTRKYQHFMGKFNPTLPAPVELRVDLRPDLARRMAARAILETGCQQVIFGGVGSDISRNKHF